MVKRRALPEAVADGEASIGRVGFHNPTATRIINEVWRETVVQALKSKSTGTIEWE